MTPAPLPDDPRSAAAPAPHRIFVWICRDDDRAVFVSSVSDLLGSAEFVGDDQVENETCPTCGSPLLGPFEYRLGPMRYVEEALDGIESAIAQNLLEREWTERIIEHLSVAGLIGPPFRLDDTRYLEEHPEAVELALRQNGLEREWAERIHEYLSVRIGAELDSGRRSAAPERG